MAQSCRTTNKAALAILLQEKALAETRVAELTQASADVRAGLEDKLRAAYKALQAAETRAESLKVTLDRVGDAVTGGAARAAAESAVDVIVAAAVATTLEREITRATVEEKVLATAKRTDAADRRAEVALAAKALAETALVERDAAARAAQSSFRESIDAARMETNHLKAEARRARAAETIAKDETAAAKSKVVELEGAMEESERAHVLARQRAELKLERLVAEEEEHGAQVCLVVEIDTIGFVILVCAFF